MQKNIRKEWLFFPDVKSMSFNISAYCRYSEQPRIITNQLILKRCYKFTKK